MTPWLALVAGLLGTPSSGLGTELDAVGPGPVVTSQIDGAPIHHYVLPNGLQVWHIERPGSTVVAVVLEVRVGARHETALDGGIAHFVEHYVHSGTARSTVHEMRRRQDRLGGVANATTSAEHTRYYRETAVAQFEGSLELIADMAIRPSFPPERLERERAILARENDGADEPLLALWRHFGVGGLSEAQLHKRVFPGSTLHHSPMGGAKSRSTIGVDALRAFHQVHYLPNNATLVISGGVDAPSVRSAVDRLLGPWSAGPLPPSPATPQPLDAQPIRIVQRGMDLKHQGELWVGARGVPAGHPDRAGLDVVAQLIQRRLFDRLRVERGLIYGVESRMRVWSDAGDFRIRATAAPEHLAQLELIIGDELASMALGAVSAEELELAKRGLLTRRALAIDRNLTRAFDLLDRIAPATRGGLSDPSQQIEAVGVADIRRLADTYLGPESRYVALHQPWVTGQGLRLALAVLAGIAVLWLIVSTMIDVRRRRATTASSAIE